MEISFSKKQKNYQTKNKTKQILTINKNRQNQNNAMSDKNERMPTKTEWAKIAKHERNIERKSFGIRSQLWLWWANLPRIPSFCWKLCAFMFQTHFITICNADIKLPMQCIAWNGFWWFLFSIIFLHPLFSIVVFVWFGCVCVFFLLISSSALLKMVILIY